MPRRWAACSTRSTMPTPASSEPRRYRGALIGAGGIARQSHLPALRGALRARVDVVALVDTAPGVPPVDGIPLLRDHTALSDLGPLDFIDICTPTASHLELTVWGLEQGYHVVCEKPVAVTRVEAERIAAARRLRCRGHGGPAVRVSRPAGDDVLHLGRAHAREPDPLRGRCRHDRMGGR